MEFDFEKTRNDIVSHRAFPYALSVIRGGLSYAVFALMSAIVLPQFRNAFYSTTEDIVKWDIAIMFLCELLLSFLMLNTVLGTFAIYYRRDRELFLAEHPSAYEKSAERRLLLRSKCFWTETCVFAVCLLSFGFFVNYQNVLKAMLPSFSPRLAHALLLALYLAGLVALRLFSAIDARDYWHELPRKLMKKSLAVSLDEKKKRIYSYWRMLLRLAGSTLLYAVGGLIITYVIVAGFSLAGVVALLIFTPSIFAIIFAIIAFYYIRAIRARIKLIRKLKKICKERNFELLELKRPYRSIFRDAYNDYNIAVNIGEKTFYCRLIACVNRGNKYTFSDDGILTRARMIHMPKPPRAVSVRGFVQTADYGNGDELEIFGFTSEIDYTFEAEGEKVILINPVPRRVRKKHGTLLGEMDNGDRMGEYSIYTGNAFLRYIDRLGIDTTGRIFHD